MEVQKGKISKFSNVVSILLKIAIIVYIVLGVLVLVAWIMSGVNLPTESILVDGVEVQVQYLFKIGNTKVSMPIIWRQGFESTGITQILEGFVTVNISSFISIIMMTVCLRYARKIFIMLKEDGSPFREEIVKALKHLAIILVVVGAFTGLVSFTAAGMIWVLSLVFEYGCVLQKESDTTL